MKFSLLVVLVLVVDTLMMTNGVSDDGGYETLDIKYIVTEARKMFKDREIQTMINGGQSAKKSNPSVDKSDARSRKSAETVAIYDIAEGILVEKHGLNRLEAQSALKELRQSDCPQPVINCDVAEKYRRVNGECNNLQNPRWGTTHMPLRRLLAPAYSGNNFEPRGGRPVSSLPQPRAISQTVHKGNDENVTLGVTHMVAQFGQFLDHDITATPEGGLSCCTSPTQDNECFTISVNETDDHYTNQKTCLDFTRSLPNCLAPTHREQMNAITAFIDGSSVYGSDARLTKMLRKFRGGELESNSEIQDDFLPWRSDVDPSVEQGGAIIAGDVRANEMPGLTVLHTLFLKEHNRIAREFQAKTNWSDDQIFEETRRLVIAEMQQISYGQYLPAILGPEEMEKFQLDVGMNTTVYDPNLDPTISNEFATAAYRFGHTLVNGLILKMIGDSVQGSYNIRDNYFIADQIVNRATGRMEGYSQILTGLIRQSAQRNDAVISDGMRNSLFKTANDIGSDLAARNIQRGRDHGIPDYNSLRKHCGLAPLVSWGQTPNEISEDTWNKLRSVYLPVTAAPTTHLDDIDLYTGGLSEISVNGGQTGPTFVCLMGEQFGRLKFGDRFFYTHGSQIGSFTAEQLDQLRARTLGDIICENSNNEISETQRNVFLMANDESNPWIDCSSPLRQKLDIDVFVNQLLSGNSSSGYISISMVLLTIALFTTRYL